MLHHRKDILNHELLLFFELRERDLLNFWRSDPCLKLHRRVEYVASGHVYRPCMASRTQRVFYQLPEVVLHETLWKMRSMVRGAGT